MPRSTVTDDKQVRHELIREIVRRNDVRDQRELLELLATEGIRTTQSTLSRDLTAIGVAKGPRGYELVTRQQAAGERKAAERVVRDTVESVAVSGSMLVIRTVDGYAQVLAREVDAGLLDGCLGTIAGKNTVFAALPSSSAAHQAQAALRRMTRRRGLGRG